MQEQNTIIRIEDLLLKKIVTNTGRKLGRVIDMKVSRGPEYKVTSLLYGTYGLLHRLHVLGPFINLVGIHPSIKEIPWEYVERIEQSSIVIRDDLTHKSNCRVEVK